MNLLVFSLVTRTIRPICACLTVGLLTSPGLFAHPVSPHAHEAVETIQQLRAIGIPTSSDSEASPPAKVPGLLKLLNQELRALIVEDLNDQSRHAVPGEDEILEQLTAAGWEEIPSHKWNAYREIRQIKFDWKPGYEPGILIVSTQLWLPYGSADPDSAIYVFQGIARRWNLVLAAESDFDPAGEKDETGMQYEISPPDSRGRWSSRRASNVLRYKALRPGVDAEKPELLLSGREKINSFFEPPFRIDIATDWFAMTQGQVRKLDGELGIAISRYELADHQVRRMAPLALTPEDFLDQWVQVNWDDAKRWSKPSSDAGLQEWHFKLNGLASDSVEIESVHLCSGTDEGDQNWLIAVSIDQRQNPSVAEENLYVEVAKKNGIFSLEAVHSDHPPRCTGKNTLLPVVDHSLPSW